MKACCASISPDTAAGIRSSTSTGTTGSRNSMRTSSRSSTRIAPPADDAATSTSSSTEAHQNQEATDAAPAKRSAKSGILQLVILRYSEGSSLVGDVG